MTKLPPQRPETFLTTTELRFGLILGFLLILTLVADFNLVKSPADLQRVTWWPVLQLFIPLAVISLFFLGFRQTGFPVFREALLAGVMISLTGAVLYSIADAVYQFGIFPERTEFFLENEAAALRNSGYADSTITRLKTVYEANHTVMMVLFRTTFEMLAVGAVSTLILIPPFSWAFRHRSK